MFDNGQTVQNRIFKIGKYRVFLPLVMSGPWAYFRDLLTIYIGFMKDVKVKKNMYSTVDESCPL